MTQLLQYGRNLLGQSRPVIHGFAAKVPRSCTRYYSSSSPAVFDRVKKRKQRNAAARLADSSDYDYLRDEMMSRLVDRLLDVTKEFPTALELGSAGGNILKHLAGHGEIKRLYMADMSEEMLHRDMQEWETRNEEGVELVPVVLDEEYLPFQENSLDMVISNMYLHWVNDISGTLKQIRKALKPDGVLLASFMGGETVPELQTAFAAADLERNGGFTPHVSPMMHVADAGNLLQSAGFTIPTVDTDTFSIGYPHALAAMKHLQNMGENNAALHASNGAHPDTLLASAAAYQYIHGTNRDHLKTVYKSLMMEDITETEAIERIAAEDSWEVPLSFQAIFMIGWSPHPSQPEPLPRGSAEYSFKDIGSVSSSKDDR
eukprot:gb/GECG01012260.1/.p1 GENE.gb/GECG01012260.1/~~gb/GECG01012260.1/.p1  ORF type:complete len:374 (+),score=50.69 gb/GECG01012260.1/:1-1122(+)